MSKYSLRVPAQLRSLGRRQSSIKIAAAALAGLSPALMKPAHAQAAVRLNVTSGHPPVFNWVGLIDSFVIPEIEKRTAGKIKFEWSKAYSGTVAKLGAESDAIRTGVSDFGIVASIFEAGKFPLQQLSLQVPFGSSDMGIVSKLSHELHDRIPELQDAWARQGLHMLGSVVVDDYALVTKFPVQSLADLKGRKIFVPGPIASWLQNTEAVAVAGNLNTYYNGIQTGVADGAIVSSANIWGIKMHEVAPHVTSAGLGAQFVGGLVINKRVFERFPKEVQEVFTQVGREYSRQLVARQSALVEEVRKNATAQGARYASMPVAERQKWAQALPNLPQEWAKQIDAKGGAGSKVVKAYIEGLKAEGVQLPRDWLK
ncbi:MAG: C4-dicarboxylate TRAP transporter substrate-binding protein [Burkholderiaceae bacterium]|jgi:TRAP-type C4-dicarboxylate transport system substrate-binding protein